MQQSYHALGKQERNTLYNSIKHSSTVTQSDLAFIPPLPMQVCHPTQGPFFEQGSLMHTNMSQAIVCYHQLSAFQIKLYLEKKKKGSKENITKAQLITIISIQTTYF
jgi:hypothetical protein